MDVANEFSSVFQQSRHIKFDKRELIEITNKSDIIPLCRIVAKCLVFYVPENDSIYDVLKKNSHKSSMEKFVCRYKLVKKTIYELLPVSWSKDEEEKQHSLYTDDDEEADKWSPAYETTNLSSKIDRLYLSTTRNDDEKTADDKLVTPFKIVKNSVQKVKRCRNKCVSSETSISNVDSISTDDEIASPKKRMKFNIEPNQNSMSNSPNSSIDNLSLSNKKLTKIKKNLSNSFANTIDNANSISPDNINDNNYTSRIFDDNRTVKMVLKKQALLKDRSEKICLVSKNVVCCFGIREL